MTTQVDPYYQYQCDNCDAMAPCPTCGQHACADECGACGGGCRCYCLCPTMREDA